MDLDHSLSWLALRLTPGLGARLMGKLLRQFDGPEEIFRASLTELEGCQLPAAVAQAVFGKNAFRDAEKELAGVRKAGIRLVTWDETEYPRLLTQIYDPPPLLYVRGNVEVLGRHAISMVGTRRPTPYGNQITERLARELAERGLVIVSGLARGIDSSAHRGACAATRGGTIGVLGSGIDVIYPKENRKLFEEVEKRGAIVTEFPMGTHPAPENFPVRNRIVAGMSLGVIVAQGAQYSGSLITSRLRNGVWARSVWDSGERDGADELCAEPTNQAGSEAGNEVGRGGGGATHGSARGAFSDGSNHGGGASVPV